MTTDVNEPIVRKMTLKDLWRIGLDTSGEWVGYVGERNGAIVAYGGAFWRDDGPAFLTFGARSVLVRGLMVGVYAKRVMKEMRARGVSHAFAYCDKDIPGVERWLAWLGLEPVGVEDGFERWEWKR